MRRAQDGDQAAYGELLDELYDATEAYLRRLVFDPHQIDDCVQECLLLLHRVRHTYDPKRPFNPWFFTLVRHRALDYLRTHRSRPSEQSADTLTRPPLESLDAEARADLERLMSQLKPVYREALNLTKIRGLSIDEAAAEAGVASGTMKARVHRGVAHLAKMAGYA